MKRVAPLVIAALLVTPALAQAPRPTQTEADAREVVDRWIAAFNKGDVSGMLKDVYLKGDEAALAAMFNKLREDSFGKLDIYGATFCSTDATHGKTLLKYARLFSFGGLMDGDEGRVFDLVKTQAGWRIAHEAGVSYDTILSCN
jgi:ketosteroid isomerase-like protein